MSAVNDYDSFLDVFPIDSLRTMNLDRYTDVGSNSTFCYWVEVKTRNTLGEIRGNNATKFGIYKMNNPSKVGNIKGVQNDGIYAWKTKYGATAAEAWETIRSIIVSIAENAEEGKIDEIERLDLTDLFKWKIAFLYSNKKLLCVYSREMLLVYANNHGGQFNNNTPHCSLYRFLLDNKPEGMSVFDYSEIIWTEVNNIKNKGKKYWIFKHKPGSNSLEDDCSQFVLDALVHNYACMQYEWNWNDGNNTVSQNWNIALNVQEDDTIFLCGGKKVYAEGHAIKPRKEISLYCKKKEEAFNISKEFTGVIGFGTNDDDLKVFYQDLSEGFGKWGERIDVDQWSYVVPDGIEVKFDNGYPAIIQIDKEKAELIHNSLVEKYKEKNHYQNLVETCHNMVLCGAPGTGKTFSAKNIAGHIVANKDYKYLNDEEKQRIGFVQFHPSYDYTDFVEGLRPCENADSSIGFERKDGVFKLFCKDAVENPGNNYVFIIDEINRGEVSKIFGELFFCVDPGYRGKDGTISTQYQNLVKKEDMFFSGFYVPENVYIIGTMNDIDRSVESIDFAFRRRFTWVEVTSKESQQMLDCLDEPLRTEAINRMDSLNAEISATEGLSSSYHIGASYFLKLKDSKEVFDGLWKYHIQPLVREYLRGLDDADKKMDNLEKAYNMQKNPADAQSGNDA